MAIIRTIQKPGTAQLISSKTRTNNEYLARRRAARSQRINQRETVGQNIDEVKQKAEAEAKKLNKEFAVEKVGDKIYYKVLIDYTTYENGKQVQRTSPLRTWTVNAKTGQLEKYSESTLYGRRGITHYFPNSRWITYDQQGNKWEEHIVRLNDQGFVDSNEHYDYKAGTKRVSDEKSERQAYERNIKAKEDAKKREQEFKDARSTRTVDGVDQYFDPIAGTWKNRNPTELTVKQAKERNLPISQTIGGKTYVSTNYDFLQKKASEYKQKVNQDWINRYNATATKINNKAAESQMSTMFDDTKKRTPQEVARETFTTGWMPVYDSSKIKVGYTQEELDKIKYSNLSGWDKLNYDVAEKTTRKVLPSFDSIVESKVKGEESKLREFDRKILPKWLQGPERTKQNIKDDFGLQAGRGLYEFVREKPLTATTYAVTFAVLPGVLKGGSKLVSLLPGKAQTVLRGTGAVAKFLLPVAYGSGKTLQIISARGPGQKGYVVGQTIGELAAISTGRAASKLPGIIKTKVVEYKLSAQVKGKTLNEVKQIAYENKALVKTTKGVSVQYRVKDVTGAKVQRVTSVKDGKYTQITKYKPIYSKSYLVEPNQVQQPDAIAFQSQPVTTGRVDVPRYKYGFRPGPKEVGPAADFFGSQGGPQRGLISSKGFGDLTKPVTLKTTLNAPYGQNYQVFQAANVKYSGVKLEYTYDYAYSTPQSPGSRLKIDYNPLRLTGSKTPNQISYTYKLDTTQDFVYKPLITESGEALGSIKYNWRTGESQFLTAGRGKPKFKNPFVTQPTTTRPVNAVEQVNAGQGGVVSVTKLEKPVQVVQGVRLRPKGPSTKSDSVFAVSKQKFKTDVATEKPKTKVKQDNLFKTRVVQTGTSAQTPIDLGKVTNRFSAIGSVSLSGQSQRIKQSVINIQKTTPNQKQLLDQIQKQDQTQIQQQVQLQDQIQKQDQIQLQDTIQLNQKINTKINRFDFIKQREKIKRETDFPALPPQFKERPGQGVFNVEVRRRGAFKSVGTFGSQREAFLKGRSVVEKTAAASFRVKGPKGNLLDPGFGLLPRTFRESKVDKNVFVQKRAFRISTGGEKSEITFKGLGVLRSRGKKQKGFNLFGG